MNAHSTRGLKCLLHGTQCQNVEGYLHCGLSEVFEPDQAFHLTAGQKDLFCVLLVIYTVAASE